MTALLDKVLAAPHGSSHLDADIYEAWGYRVIRLDPEHKRGWKYFDMGSRRWRAMNRLTSNIRDALWHVPAGKAIAILIYADGRAIADIVDPADLDEPTTPAAAIPALAVCAAILRAGP